MILAPKIITGFLHAQNKGACDWGWQGAVAYGCHNFVVVIETKTVQVYQVLDKHKATVIKVKWARENYHHDTGSPYSLRLASGDTNGGIVIWDVAQGREKIEFSDGNKPIQDMEWLPCQDASHDLLLVLHPPYSLILWNADTGTKLWKKSYTESLLSFSLDPFCYRNVAFLGQDCILFIDDFSITKTPSSNGKKFYISSPSGSKGDTPSNTLERKSSSSSRNLAKRMTKILVGEGKQRGEEENIALNECIQLTYHKACRHHLILVYAREILILDLEINQTVGTIPMDRTGSPFLEVIPVHQRDVLFCLHENGSITCRVRRRQNALTTSSHEGFSGGIDESFQGLSPDIVYDLRSQSDSIRMTRHCKVTGMMCCPVMEKNLALILSDSRVIFWELHTVDFQEGSSHNTMSPLYTPGSSQYTLAESQASDITLMSDELTEGPVLPVVTSIPSPKLALGDMIGQSQVLSPDSESASRGHGVSLKFLMTGLLNGIYAPVTVIRMCPPLTTKNLKEYSPLLAVGSQIGKIQILHLGSGHIEREYSLHTSTVRGIEWASLKSFISYSYPKPAMSNQVKNEIFLMDITSGKATAIRGHKDQESPIEMIRISHNKQYFLVAFKDKPLELWDLKALTMLRGMSHKLPFPTALEWSPSPGLKALKRKLQQQQLQQQLQQQQQSQQQGDQQGPSDPAEEGPQGGVGSLDGTSDMSTSISASSSSASMNGASESQPNILAKEHFIYTDSDGTLYHFAVEGSSFVDASKIPSESGMGTITWVAWKADFLVFGDADGQLCVWDLRAKTSRTNSTHRGWIKKIRFAPGRSHFKFLILYNDGVDVWDLKEGKPELVSSIRSPREIAKVIDAEWAGSDRPVLVTVDGCIHMYDMTLKRTNCTIDERDNQEHTFEPYIVPQKVAFLSKLLLQHQKWSPVYELKLVDLGGGGDEEEEKTISMVNNQLKNISNDVGTYLPHCRFGTAERCLLTARLFGDESEIHFWTIALHYLRAAKSQPVSETSSAIFSKQEDDIYRPQMSGSKDSCDLDLNVGNKDTGSPWLPFKDQPLEKCYDFLCDNQSYKKYQLDRVALHDSKRPTHDHTRKCAENLIMLGQTDRAVQLLLETEPDADPYYIDSLRACLVASIRSSGASQSTIKLVATNLIASGKLQEGVQLLCLIDKGLDACRYLQTYGAWAQAVWLAKSTLDNSECCEVMKRWVDHLCSTHVNQKSTAVLVMLSLGQFYKVLEMLYGMRQFNRAACFVEAALEFGMLEKSAETGPLIEAVFLEYARILSNLGHKKAAEYYCMQAGEKGKQLLKEVEILFS